MDEKFIALTQEWHTKGWNARQGEIEKLESELSTTKQVLGNVIDMEVAKVDNLKAQLNNMEQCYIEKKKECEDQQKRIEVASSLIRGICRFINEDNPRCVDALAVTVDCELIRIECYLRGAND